MVRINGLKSLNETSFRKIKSNKKANTDGAI